MILDTHVHVWDRRRLDYPWLASVPELDAEFLPADVDRAGGRTTGMVFVEADRRPDQALAEARWVAGLAGDAWPELRGIVAAVDLRSPSLEADLDALQALPRIVGVRHLLQDEHVDAFPSAAAGLRELARRGLTFDACVRHEQLPALLDLLRPVEGLRVVLDHLGKPPVDGGIDGAQGRAWAGCVDRLAELPGIHVKLSGLAAEAADATVFDRRADAFIAHAFAAFGSERAMLGSDWPVSRRLGAAVPFAAWIERVRHATGASDDEWDAVAHRTGERFYGLG